MRGLVRFLAGASIVVASFMATTYFLRQFSGNSESQNTAAPPASEAKEGPPPVAQQIRGINLAVQPSDFADPQWQPEGLTATPSKAGSGTTTVFKLVETAANGMHRIETHAHRLTPGDIHTLSVFVRPGDRSRIR